MPLPSLLPPLLRVALAASLWGLWALFLRPSGLSGPQCALLTTGVMALPALLLVRRLRVRGPGATAWLGAMGVCNALNCVLYFDALQRGPLVVAVLTHYLAPLLVALCAPVLLGERLSRRALVATPLLLGALALVLGRPEAGAPLTTALLGAGSALGYAGVVLAAKRAARAYSVLEVTSLHAAVSTAVLLALFGTAGLPPLAAPTLPALAGALVCGLGATVLFNAGLARAPAAVAGALTYLEPLVAALLGWGLFGERLGPAALVGGAAMLGLGAWVALGEAQARAPTPRLPELPPPP